MKKNLKMCLHLPKKKKKKEKNYINWIFIVASYDEVKSISNRCSPRSERAEVIYPNENRKSQRPASGGSRNWYAKRDKSRLRPPQLQLRSTNSFITRIRPFSPPRHSVLYCLSHPDAKNPAEVNIVTDKVFAD